MTKNFKISIVTVVFNGASTLERTIKSVIAQNYDSVEYIIIDGASTDGTLSIIDKYKDHLAYFHSKKDKGIYDAMNQGIDIATGDYIALINADDWLEDNVIEKIVNILQCNEKIDILHGNINYIRNNESKLYKPKLDKKAFLWHGMSYFHPTFFVKKEVYNTIKYDETYKLLSDYKFTLECFNEGYCFYYFDEVIVNFSADGASSNFRTRILEGHNIRLENGYSRVLVYLSTLLRIFKTMLSYVKRGLHDKRK